MTVMVQESPSRGSDPDGRPDHLIRESEEARAKSGSGSPPGPGKGSYSVRQIAAAEPARMRTAYGHFIGRFFCLPARDVWDGSDPPRRWHGSAHQPTPQCRSGRQKRGVAPVHLRIPRSARPSSEPSCNPTGDNRLEKSVRAHAPLCPMCTPRSAPSPTYERSKSTSSNRVAR